MASVGSCLGDATERLRRAGSETPRLDAELLVGHALGLERTSVLAHPEASVGDGQAAVIGALVDRRAAGEPVAYIRGLKEFHGLAFAVDARALIPRPETELLVDLAFARVREHLTGAPRPAGSAPVRVWEVGTGSGCVVIALIRALRRGGHAGEVELVASDLSRDALALAVENAVAHGVADRITFGLGDLLAVEPRPAPVALIVANLPYVPSADLPRLPIAASFEPALALDGGPDGLAQVRRLLEQLPGALTPDGAALLEVGSDQADAARAAVSELLPDAIARVHPDLAGAPRVVEVALGPAPDRS